MYYKDLTREQILSLTKSITLQCDHCGSDTSRRPYELRLKLDSSSTVLFCSNACRSVGNNIDKICKNCGGAFTVKRNKQNQEFCSVSCSNTSRKKHYHCPTCGTEINRQAKYCSKKCNPAWTHISTKTIKQAMYNGEHQGLRSYARSIYLKSNDHICKCCGYTKHIDVCHIRPIHTFDYESTLVSVVNELDNLIGLCKNCHWELDHDFDHDVKELLSNC